MAEIDKKLSSLLDKIVDANSDIVVKAYEKKIIGLEDEKRVLQEKATGSKQPNIGQYHLMDGTDCGDVAFQ